MVVELIAGGLVTLLLEKALGYKVTKDENGNTVITAPDGTRTIIQPRSLKFMDTFPDRLTASGTSKPTSPQFSYDNPLDAIIQLLSMDLIPQVSTRQYLEVAIEVNEKIIFDSTRGGTKTGFFTDLDSFALPIPTEGFDFLQAKKIRIFVWSNTVSQTPVVTVNGLVGSYDN